MNTVDERRSIAGAKGWPFREYGLSIRMLRKQAAEPVVFRPGVPFNGVKVFSATMFNERVLLGDKVTAWIESNPRNEVTEIHVTQSSDASFHCIALTVFYRAASEPAAGR